eukprot:m.285405 g.285405  ORF g.285405 m.285405 type:complete len:109 (+) comp11365_c0_seq1:43-369(+)
MLHWLAVAVLACLCPTADAHDSPVYAVGRRFNLLEEYEFQEWTKRVLLERPPRTWLELAAVLTFLFLGLRFLYQQLTSMRGLEFSRGAGAREHDPLPPLVEDEDDHSD